MQIRPILSSKESVAKQANKAYIEQCKRSSLLKAFVENFQNSSKARWELVSSHLLAKRLSWQITKNVVIIEIYSRWMSAHVSGHVIRLLFR